MPGVKVVRIAVAALALLGAVASSPVSGQVWPARPVKLVVPFPPGGSVDALARLVGARLAESLGQQFIVENRTGASGSIGTAFVVKSPPDGYTFVIVSDTHAINPALIPHLPFDTVNDLAAVMLIGTAPMAIVTGSGQPYKTFADVVNAARAKPNTMSYGSVGNGSLGHLTMALLQQAGDFTAIHVPYKGGGPMATDVIGSQIDLGVASAAALLPYVKAGKVRCIALTAEARLASMPEVPTLAEQGFRGFAALASWSLFAPAGTPRPIIDKMNAEFAKALNLPELRRQLTEQLGMDLVISSPEASRTWTLGEIERWGRIVKENNIRAQ